MGTGSVAAERSARAAQLRTYEALRVSVHEIATRLDAAADPDLAGFERRALARAEDIRAAYLEALPRVALSRCPHTNAELRIAIDTTDIDGLWWDYFAPVRSAERVLPTLYAVTGALALRGAPARTSFLVKPGPAAPCVLPRLLERPAVRAVVSAVAIGKHQGYVVAYYSTDYLRGEKRANDWGANEYRVYDERGEPAGWDSVAEDEREMDFALAPWIERGKLAWIAPGDAALRLETAARGCPFLDLGGSRQIQRIEEGRIR